MQPPVHVLSLVLWFGFTACKGGGDGDDLPAFIEGSVTTADADAEVAGRTAYGYHLEGKGLWYISTASEVSCEEVVAYLTHSDSSEPYDPQQVLYGGYCNVSVVLNDYSGEAVSLSESDGVLAAVWSLYCPMGTGEFVVEDRHGHEDYYWTGPVWTGAPTAWELALSGDGESGPYTLEIGMDGFEGTYSDVVATIPATGEVLGRIDAQLCPDLYWAPVFPK